MKSQWLNLEKPKGSAPHHSTPPSLHHSITPPTLRFLLVLRGLSELSYSMKTAYELAMERLSKSAPAAKLSEKQKKDLAELDSKYTAKIAEREIFVKGELEKAAAKNDFEAYQQLEKQLVSDRKTLHAELEEKKEKVRAS